MDEVADAAARRRKRDHARRRRASTPIPNAISPHVAGSGTSTLPIVVYGMARRNVEPSINAISTIILVVTTAVLYLAERVTRER